MSQLEKYTAALLLFELERAKQAKGGTDPLLLLSRAGLTHAEIAGLIDKKPAAVQKAVERARKRRPRQVDE